MQIKIDLKIFIFAIIFILTRQIKLYAFLMFFALIHEIGHLIAGLCMGLKPKSIEIAPYGFSLCFKTECDDYNKKIKNASKLSLKKIIIAAAGPTTNLLIAIIAYVYFLSTHNAYIGNVGVDMIIYSNILLFLFNLIPIYPLDGGRILKEVININGGIAKAYIYSNKISNVSIIILSILTSFFVLAYKNIAIIIVIAYLWIIIINQNKRQKYLLELFGKIAKTS